MKTPELRTTAVRAALADVAQVDAVALREAKLHGHWAAQVLAAVGFSFLPPKDDFSHTSVSLDPTSGLLQTDVLPERRLRASLSLAELSLRLVGDGVDERLELAGNTVAQAMAWMQRSIERAVEREPADGAMKVPVHDLPPHPLADGQPFDRLDSAALRELAAWFAAGHHVATAVADASPGASAVRCWPHHFDIATLITLAGSGEDARTVGVGTSPGDGSYAEPYIYVTPWPYPKNPKLPALGGGGSWHTEGWVGAVLTATAIANHDATARADAVAEFIETAVPAAHTLVGDKS